MDYKPIGGIERCSLSAANAVDQSIVEVTLAEDCSEYTQTIDGSKRAMVVQHTLTLVAPTECAERWFDPDFLELVLYDGVVATLSLNSNAQITTPTLRLQSLTSTTSKSVEQQPTTTLVLSNQTTTLNRPDYE